MSLPERHYCVIEDPVQRNKDGSVFVNDKTGETKNRIGDFEYRFQKDFSEPFPLYHGEKVKKPATKLTVISGVESLRIEAIRNFKDNSGIDRCAGDQWMVHGPCTYYPRVEEVVKERV